jgi:hypothetical protein
MRLGTVLVFLIVGATLNEEKVKYQLKSNLSIAKRSKNCSHKLKNTKSQVHINFI